MSNRHLQMLENFGQLPSDCITLERVPVANLSKLKTAYSLVLAVDGRKAGEPEGAGTGTPVWRDGAVWRTFYDNSQVKA